MRPVELGRLIDPKLGRNTASQWWNGERIPSGYQMGWLIQALHLTVAELEYLVGKPPAAKEQEKAVAAMTALRNQTLRRAGLLDQLEAGPAPRTPKPPKEGSSGS